MDFFMKRGADTQSKTWLDVGCGEGTLLALGQSYFKEVAGCDVSNEMMQSCSGLNVRRQETAHELPFEDGSFDFVTAVCVYHHVEAENHRALTRGIGRVLKPDGVFCLIEHNPLNPVTQLIVRRSPVDTNARLLTPRTARDVVRNAGMHVIDTSYFLFFPQRLYSKMAAVENALSSFPLGGQYSVFSGKNRCK
jgi:SAM-dependent methyltransferase